MVAFDLISNHLKNYYIKGTRYCFIVFLIMSIVLAFLSLFYNFVIVLSLTIATCALAFLFVWNRNKRKYGNKFSCDNETVVICDYKGQKVKEFKLDSMKRSYLSIAFDFAKGYSYQKCLILYNGIEPYEKMEYSSYWNDPNIVIIQNPSLIEMIDKRMESIN